MDMSVNPPLTSIGSETSFALVVEIDGQVDLPDVGLCAPDGTQLSAVVTGASAAQLATATYQWATVEAGPIAGATGSTYTVSAGGMDENRLYLSVAIPEMGTGVAAAVTICNAPPQLQVPLSDIVFDFESGPQSILTADNFSGSNLRYSVVGPQASIDEITGHLSVDTAATLEDELILVQASNSGGSVSTQFNLSVEDGPDGGDVDTVMFGALTAAGAGGVPVSGASVSAGDPSGHWQIANGELMPSAQGQAAELADAPYELSLDDGARIDVLVSDDVAHARPTQAEVLAAYIALPDSGGKLLIRDGNDQLSSRWVFPQRAFTGTCVIEPAEWVEDADPRLSVRNALVPGLTFGKGTENVTIQGLDIYDDTTHGEGEGTTGIVHIPRPSLNINVRQNRIHSRDFVEIWNAGDFSDNFGSSRVLRGVIMNESSSDGLNVNFRVDDNWFHDVGRAAYVFRVGDGPNGERSSFNRNYVEDVYTNFVTSAHFNGLDILDNKCLHVWAAGEDTLTPSNQQSVPHSGIAGFDTGGYRASQRLRFLGNLMHIGWKRGKLHRDNGLPDPALKTTGVKFNDPKGPEAYYDLDVAFNLIVTHGIGLEFSACDTVSIHNNTLVTETYNTNAGSLPIYYFSGVSNTQFWNNLGQLVSIGAEDDTSENFPRSLDGIIGYGYLSVTEDDFEGIPGKGLELLELDELAAAYAPKLDHYALTAASAKGALGTGLYLNNGGHNATYAVPVSTATPSTETREVFFDGSAYLEGGNIGPGTKQFTCAARFRCHADDDGVATYLYSSSGAALIVTKLSSGRLAVRIKKDGASSAELAVKINSSVRIDSPMGWVDFAVSVDVSRGIAQMAFNGVLDPMINITDLEDEILDFDQYLARIGRNVLSNPANAQVCAMGQFFLDNTFVDLESDEGYSKVFGSDGRFTDWGPDGGAVTGGVRPLIYMAGDRTSYINRGQGGAFLREGLLQDVGTRDFDVPRIQGLYLGAGTPGSAISHTDIGAAGRLHIMARPLQSSSVDAPEKVEVRDGYWNGAPAAYHRTVDVAGPEELILSDFNLPGQETSSVAYEVFYMSEDPVSGLMGEVYEITYNMQPTGDVTVPVLNTPVASEAGGGDWTVSAITDTSEGIVTAVLTSFATAPTPQQVAAGQNHLGEVQPFSKSADVTQDGAQSITFSGLALSTVYHAHVVHVDAVGNASEVITASSFTTSSSAGSTIVLAEGSSLSAAAEVTSLMRTQIVAFPIRITNLMESWSLWTSSTGLGTQSGFWAVEDTSGYYNRLVNSGGVQTTASAIPGVLTEGEWSNVMIIFTPNRQEVIVDGQVVLTNNNASTSFKAYRELVGPPVGSGTEVSTKGARIYGTNDASLDADALAVVVGDVFDSEGFVNNDPDVRGIPLLWSQ